MRTKTERFRGIAYQRKDEFGDSGPYVWYEDAPGTVVTVHGFEIKIIESTNYHESAEATYGGEPDTENWWVIVEFEGDLYRIKGLYNSWSGTEWEDWERVEERPVT